MIGGLSEPKYRDHTMMEPVTMEDMQTVSASYVKILLNHMDFSVEKWNKMLKVTEIYTLIVLKNVT